MNDQAQRVRAMIDEVRSMVATGAARLLLARAEQIAACHPERTYSRREVIEVLLDASRDLERLK